MFVFLGLSLWGSIPLEGSSDPLTDEAAVYLETAGLVQDAEEGGRMREGEIPCMRVFWELVTLVRRGCLQTPSPVSLVELDGILWPPSAWGAPGPAGLRPHKIQTRNYFCESITRD